MLNLCRFPGCRHPFVPPLAAALVLILSTAGHAQQSLPTLLLSSQSPLDEDQQQLVALFVEQHMERMLNAEDVAEISDARRELIRPLQNRITREHAHTVISEEVAAALPSAVERNSMHLRINALLIAGELSTSRSAVVPLVADSFGHPAAAVRLLAAKTVTRLNTDEDGDGPLLDNDDQEHLLDALADSLGEEPSELVLESMYAALGTIALPRAREVLLDTLGERVNRHADGITESLRADQRGIDGLLQLLTREQSGGGEIDEPLRQLTILSARLLDILTRDLQDDEVSEGLIPVAIITVATIEEVFQTALEHFDPTAASGQPLSDPAAEGDFDELRLNALEWLGTEDNPGLLTDSAVGLEFPQLQLPD